MELKQWLENSGMSQCEFAKKIDTTQSAVSKYVLRKRRPKPHIIGRIIDATSGAVTIEDLVLMEMCGNE